IAGSPMPNVIDSVTTDVPDSPKTASSTAYSDSNSRRASVQSYHRKNSSGSFVPTPALILNAGRPLARAPSNNLDDDPAMVTGLPYRENETRVQEKMEA